MKKKVSEMESAIMDYIMRNLPSGSGIDMDWESKYQKDSFVFKCSYHCMNDGGYYDGWQDFKVVVSKSDWTNFSLHFTGNRKENYIFLLREYLEEILNDSIMKSQDDLEGYMSDRITINLEKVFMRFQCKEEACTNKKIHEWNVRQIIEVHQPYCPECEELMEECNDLKPYLDR